MGTTARKLPLLLALSFILTLSPAWADGNTLLEQCRESDMKNPTLAFTYGRGYCHGMVAGVTEVFNNLGEILPQKLKVCLPDSVTTGQVVKVVVKYLKENPAELHHPESYLIMDAIQKAFPCR